jgi:hypothetical protein
MILFIPVGILLVFALIVIILGRTRFNIIQSWITSLIAAILAWSSFLIIKLMGIIDWSSSYLNINGLQDVLVRFKIDERDWVFGILLISLLIAFLLNETIRISDKKNPDNWSRFIVITALGLMVIMARSLLAFIFTSTLLDLGVLIHKLISQKSTEQNNTPVLSFVLHSIGTLLILFGMASAATENLFLIIVGALFRIGDFSSFVDSNVKTAMKYSQMDFADFVIPLSTLAFFYENEISIGAFSGKYLIISIWCILGIALLIKAFTNKEAVLKQKAWIDSFSWLGFFLILSGNTHAIIPFSIVFITLGGVQSFSIIRKRGISIGLFLLALGLIGFPYTPSFGVWLLVDVQKPDFFFIVNDLFLVFLFSKVFNKLIDNSTIEKTKEDWIGIVSTASSIFLLLVAWTLEFWLKPISIDHTDYFYPGLFLILYTLLFVVGKIANVKKFFQRFKSRYGLALQQVIHWLSILLSFKWVLRLFSAINKIIAELVNLFTRVLDGEGGLLWAFVFLILLSTVLMANRIP